MEIEEYIQKRITSLPFDITDDEDYKDIHDRIRVKAELHFKKQKQIEAQAKREVMIIEEVKKIIDEFHLDTPDRSHPIIFYRYYLWNHLRENTRMTYEAIGKLFGGRGHDTIMNGCNNHKDMLECEDSTYLYHVKVIKNRLKTDESKSIYDFILEASSLKDLNQVKRMIRRGWL